MKIGYQLSFFFTVLNITTVFGLFGLPRIISSKTHQNASTTKLFNCLSNVTRTYFDRQSIYLHFDVFGTVDYMANVDSFTKAVQSPKVIVPYSSFSYEQQLMKGVFAFLAEDRVYLKLLNITQQSYFLAVWTKQTHVNYVRLVFRDFWTYGKHINVVGLVMMDDGTVNAYTYRPFSNYGCSKLGRPLLLDNWQNGRFRSGVDLFSQKPKTGNMRGCELKCVGNEHPPDSVMRHDGRRWTTSGVGGKVLEILARYMNFSPVITSPKSSNVNEMYSWYDSADVLNNISVMLITEEADLAFGWYSFATHKHEYNTKLARATSIDCLGWAVPYRAGPPPKSWTNYVNEFDKVGWLFIGSMFMVVVGVFYFFRKLKKLHGVDSVVFFVYHTTIDQPTRVQPIWCSLRTFTIHWLWYCMVINVAYKASLGSFMTVPPHGIEFTRMDQILNSHLITMASPQSLQIINGTTTTTRISRTFMNRLQQLPPTNFEHIIDRLVIKRDIALFEVKRFMYYYSKPQAKRIKVKIPIRFLPGCLLRTHTTQFMLNGGSYLTDSVDALLSTLFETGIVDHWITHLGSNKVLPLEKIRGRVLKFVRLKETFLFLFFSYGIAFVVFVGEICWSKRLDRRLLQLLSIRRTSTDCTGSSSITTPCRGPNPKRHCQSKSSQKTLPFVH